MTKFYQEFMEKTNNEYSMLKLNSAIYDKAKHKLTIKFIISTFEMSNLTDDMKKNIQTVCGEMFEGVNVNIEYIKTYADENVVRNKILEYFNKHNQIIFRMLNNENTNITVSDSLITINFNLETPLYKMFDNGNTVDSLQDFLDSTFNQDIGINLSEKVVELSQEDLKKNLDLDTVYVGDSTLRLIDLRVGKKVFARPRIGGINQMATYIEDVKGDTENIILCGKVTNLNSKKYKNKKYDPDNPKMGPEEKTLVKFLLDDTTGKFDCICFPNEEQVKDIECLVDNDTVVCIGNVKTSSYNQQLQYMVDGMFMADINFKSIREKASKPVPKHYMTVLPEKYVDISQNSLFDMQGTASDEYFKDKTFVIYDLEATDTNVGSAEIIEIAALKVVNGVATESFQTLVNPGIHIPETIVEITHIDDSMVEFAPTIDKVIPDFYKFSRNSILVGHNIVDYDYPLLNKYCKEFGYKLDNDVVDTLLLSRKYFKELKSKALVDLAKHFDIEQKNAHRALSDVEATFGVLKELAKRMYK